MGIQQSFEPIRLSLVEKYLHIVTKMTKCQLYLKQHTHKIGYHLGSLNVLCTHEQSSNLNNKM